MKRILALLIILSVMAGLCGCQRMVDDLHTPTPPEDTDAYTQIVIPSGPASINTFGMAWSAAGSLNPISCSSGLNLKLTNLMYESLYSIDSRLRARENLCTSAVHNGNVWIFTIKKDRTFSDGSPLTAADVEYSLNLALNKDSNYFARLTEVDSVLMKDEFTLEIVTKKEMGRLPILLDVPVIKNGSGDDKCPPGSGAYVFVQGEGENSSYLKASVSHRDSLSIPVIQLVDIPEAEMLVDSFETGRIAVVNSDPNGTDAPVFGGDYEEWEYSTTNMVYLGFNTKTMSDPVLRMTLSRLIERDSICREDMSGMADAAYIPICSKSWSYGELYKTLYTESSEYPLEDGIRLLSQLGYEDTDGDGFLDKEKGKGKERQTFTIKMLVCSDNESKAAVMRRVAEDWRLLGIDVQLSELGWDSYLSALSKQEFDIYLGELRLRADMSLDQLVGSDAALNYGKYSNPDTDALLMSVSAADENKLINAEAALIKNLIEQAPIIPLLFKNELFLARRGLLKNVSPLGWDVYNNIEYWQSAG